MKDLVKLYVRPSLTSPIMLAAWPGIGDVAMIAATYLKNSLSFQELGEIEAAHFFDPIGVAVRDSVIEAPQFPQCYLYYYDNPASGGDIILFIGEDQPPVKGYELANCVVDIGLGFKVQRIYTCAAAVTHIHHSEQPQVWGVATNQSLLKELSKYQLIQQGDLHIAGLNGLMLGVAKERGLDGICLLGEVPTYATRIQNPKAALAVLNVLTRMLGVEIDVAELVMLSKETEERMRRVASEAMEEYIDRFTEPIWEQGPDEEDEED